MSEEQSEARPRKARRRAPPARRAPHRRLGVGLWMILSNLVLITFLAYLVLSLTESAITMPRWITQRVQAQANAAMTGGALSIGRLALRVNDAGLPAVEARNIGIYDARGFEVARLNQAAVRLAPAALLRQEIRPRFLDVSGAQMTIRRLADGQIDLSFGNAQTGRTTSVGALFDELDAIFALDFMSAVDRLGASDLTITLEDVRSGRIWQITDGRLAVERAEDGLDVSVDFAVFNGTVDLAETQLRLRTAFDSSAASLTARFKNATAADIALQSPALSYLGVLNAPISGSLRTSFGDDGEVRALNGSLEIGKGVLQPTPETTPIPFDRARTFFGYVPADQKITFSELSVDGTALAARASGHAYLHDFDGTWPNTLIGQLRLGELRMNPAGLWQDAPEFTGGAVDMRLRLAPFAVEFGQVTLRSDAATLAAKGRIAAGEAGWSSAADVTLDQVSMEELASLWPEAVLARTRDWLVENVSTAQFSNLRLALRRQAGAAPQVDFGFHFTGGALRVVRGFPLLEGATGYGKIQNEQVTIVLDAGHMQAPLGGRADLAGTVFRVADTTARPSQAELTLKGQGPAPAFLSILALPPVNLLAQSGLSPDFLQGETEVTARLSYPMKPNLAPGELRYEAVGTVQEARSDVLVPGRTLQAELAEFSADNDGITVGGQMRLGKARGRGNWIKRAGPDFAGQSDVVGQVVLNQDFLDEFNIALPPGFLSGAADARFEMALREGQPPSFSLTSDLVGARLSLAELGWSKPEGRAGNLLVEGVLGDAPEVTRLSLSAPGLSLSDGRVTLRQDGGLDRAVFGQAVVGGWLSAPVEIVGRGPGLPPRIAITGGTVDLRRTDFGSGAGGSDIPITYALDRLIVTRSIALSEVTGDLSTRGGLSGKFAARVNGGAPITGQIEPTSRGSSIRIRSRNGGRVLRDAGIFPAATGGAMELILTPRQGDVLYRGRMTITDTNVQRAPVLTELLSALSIVGLLDQMRGAGIVFTEVQATFDIYSDKVRLLRSSAVGPSLGVSLDGVYDLNSSTMDMQGVISPVYFLNAIGQIISPRRGEGLFGFNFRLQGPADGPTVQVNPLSILTPGAFRDIFRAPPPGEDDQ